jgi:hypothetical protein
MDNKRISFSAGAAILLVLLLYVVFIWIGPWRERGYTSNYYFQMASAFRHGQIALETKPDPALLALPNPYDHKARKNIPLLGDASLYKGKYYLYFGPLPSLMLVPILILLPIQPGDQIFVYIFLIGLFLIQSLFLITIVRQYFSRVPQWIVAGAILLLGVTGPFTRMLAHPFIHEAAISGGQFFSTAGLYLAFLALRKGPIDKHQLFWAGVLWACAIATRTTQLIPVAAMTLLTCFFVIQETRKQQASQAFFAPALALITPLLICGVLLAWYNWARFDSIFEFGLYYQLAAFNLQANYSILFSRVYIIQNIYNYFLNSFKISAEFPFAFPLPGSEKPIFLSPDLPNLYAVEGKFPGLLNSTPFLIFAIIPVCVVLARFWKGPFTDDSKMGFGAHFHWTVFSLISSFIAGSIPTLLIFYVGFRYETEFITGLLLLALIGLCQIYSTGYGTRFHRIIMFGGAMLLVFSIIVNVILAFTGVRA